jgi:chromosome segregation ATPase
MQEGLEAKYTKKIDSRADSLDGLQKDITRKSSNLEQEKAKAEPKLGANAQKISSRKNELSESLAELKKLKPTAGK